MKDGKQRKNIAMVSWQKKTDYRQGHATLVNKASSERTQSENAKTCLACLLL